MCSLLGVGLGSGLRESIGETVPIAQIAPSARRRVAGEIGLRGLLNAHRDRGLGLRGLGMDDAGANDANARNGKCETEYQGHRGFAAPGQDRGRLCLCFHDLLLKSLWENIALPTSRDNPAIRECSFSRDDIIAKRSGDPYLPC
jgi:hypothetical protein